MPSIPTTMLIQHGFAVVTYSKYDHTDNDTFYDGDGIARGCDGFRQVTSYIKLDSINGFRLEVKGLFIDVKGHIEHTRLIDLSNTGTTALSRRDFLHRQSYVNTNSSYILVGCVASNVVATLCEALAPFTRVVTGPPLSSSGDSLGVTGPAIIQPTVA